MKSVLLYANEDAGLQGRMEAALDAVRLFDGHLTCVQVTPFDAFIMGDPFGGAYALPSVVAAVQEAEDKHRARLEAKLQGEGVAWDWLHFDGAPGPVVVDRARLSDLIVLSPASDGADYDGPQGLAAEVAVHARAPVLAVPKGKLGVDLLGPAMVAWNGSQESCNALRAALPLLARASTVHVVTVADEDAADFPATQAAHYLARSGVETVLHDWPREGRGIADALIDAAAVLNASYLVMGAYGHSRFRESVLGGVTRDMLRRSPVPLVLAH